LDYANQNCYIQPEAASMPIKIASARLMLGHLDPKTTMIYINQRPRDTIDAQEQAVKNMGL